MIVRAFIGAVIRIVVRVVVSHGTVTVHVRIRVVGAGIAVSRVFGPRYVFFRFRVDNNVAM